MDFLFLIGIAILFGLIGGRIGNFVKLPAVVGYIVFGVFLGPSLIGLFNPDLLDRMGIISDMALGIIAFVIGVQLPLRTLRKLGAPIIAIILAESFGAFLVVTLGVYLLTHKLYVALVFGAMAPASAPAGTVAVLQEHRARGPLTNALLAVVGFDDGLAILIYAFAIAVAKLFIAGSGKFTFQNAVAIPLLEIGGAIVLGILIGILSAYLMKKVRHKGDLLSLSLGSIFVCAGLANALHFSLILSSLFLGMTAASAFPVVGRRALGAIEDITPPIYVIFFVLAGAHLQLGLLGRMGVLGLIYIIGRTIGLMGGSFLGATAAKAEPNIRKYLPFGILSQAGVAIGLAILVGRELGPLGGSGHDLALLVINTIAATTIIFEIVGPIATKFAISRAGETEEARARQKPVGSSQTR